MISLIESGKFYKMDLAETFQQAKSLALEMRNAQPVGPQPSGEG